MIALNADRPQNEATIAVAGTCLIFVVALCLALPQPPNPWHVALGTVVAAPLILVGFLSASRMFFRPVRHPFERVRLAVFALSAGATLGAALLTFLIAAAKTEPALRARFAGRVAEPTWRPWALAFESSILEEIAFRLVALSIIAWLTNRLLNRRGVAMFVALAASAVLFGLAHLPAWLSVTSLTPAFVGAVLVLNGAGGVLFGWVFWRWGLPYAILCHFAGDVVIQAFGPKLLS